MKPITYAAQVECYGNLVREMMLTQEGEGHHFNSDWVRSHGWEVVPTEEMGHIPQPDIPRLVSVLNGAGYTECLAVFNESGYIQDLPVVVASEPPSDMPTCYLLSVDEANFLEFNRELGPFRFLLTTEDRSWAISCTEWYNLFAGRPGLLEALLGKPIEQARMHFLEFAAVLAKGNPDEPLLRVAKHYAVL